jgi:hypothetical protein
MDEKAIRNAWREIGKYTGEYFERRETEFRNACKNYARSILEAQDEKRIQAIGLKYIRKAAEGELNLKQLSNLYTSAYRIESRLKKLDA